MASISTTFSIFPTQLFIKLYPTHKVFAPKAKPPVLSPIRTQEELATAIDSLAASIDRLAEAFANQGKTSGKVYPTMEPLAAQTLAEKIKYLGDMIRPLETHTLAGAVKDLGETLKKQ